MSSIDRDRYTALGKGHLAPPVVLTENDKVVLVEEPQGVKAYNLDQTVKDVPNQIPGPQVVQGSFVTNREYTADGSLVDGSIVETGAAKNLATQPVVLQENNQAGKTDFGIIRDGYTQPEGADFRAESHVERPALATKAGALEGPAEAVNKPGGRWPK